MRKRLTSKFDSDWKEIQVNDVCNVYSKATMIDAELSLVAE